MKKLTEIKVNASKLKLIIGENINYPFPQEKYYPKPDQPKLRTLQVTLDEVIKGSSWARKRSHDERFDNKHPLELALASIQEKGLNKSIIAAIRNDYKCQKQAKITGKWAVLNDVITDEHRKHIINLLLHTVESNIQKFGERYYDR